METERTLKVGDVCLDCQQQLGIEKRLRYFKLNLNGDTLLKCESNECMYPYNDEMYSTDEELEVEQEDKDVQNIKFIDDFIKQYTNDTVVQDSPNNMSNITENVSTQFDITFLDNFNDNENPCKMEISQGTNELLDCKTNVHIIENEFLSLPVINSEENVMQMANVKKQNLDENLPNNLETLPILFALDYDIKSNIVKENVSLKDVKPKIDIQSIETIDIESPLYNILPMSSKTLTTSREIPSTSFNISTKLSSSSLETPFNTNKNSISCNGSTKICKLSLPSSTLTKSLEDSLSNIPTFTISTEISSTSSNEPNETTKLTSTSLNIKTSDIPLKDQQPNTSELTKSNEENSKTLDKIPKANIMMGRDFLKKLAIVDEKLSKQNFNSNRKKKKTINKEVIKNEEKPVPSFSGNTDFSLEKISEILTANRMKRKNINK